MARNPEPAGHVTQARRALRGGTHDLHRRVDEIFSRADLSRRDDYAAFLMAQAAALFPTEQALERAGADGLVPGWHERKRSELLRADLLALGETVPLPIATPTFSSAAEAWGGIYVLEGSRLGAALLRRAVAPHFAAAFLGAAAPATGWRRLLRSIDERLTVPADVALATAAARRVFILFEQAGAHFIVGRAVGARG